MDKFNSVAKHIQKNLLAGLLTVLPLGITFFILKFIFTKADGILKPILSFVPWVSDHNTGISAALVFALIYLVGLISSHVLGKPLMEFLFHKIPQRIPVINKLHSMFKGFVDALSPSREEKSTGKVVCVKLDIPGMDGFVFGLLMNTLKGQKISRITDDILSNELYGAVFLSSSPLPNSGQLVFVPMRNIYDTSLSQEQYMAIVASMGTVTPDTVNFK